MNRCKPEPDSHFDPPEDEEKCSECGKMATSWTFIEYFGIVCYDCQASDVEPNDDPGPVIDRDCDYWNRITGDTKYAS